MKQMRMIALAMALLLPLAGCKLAKNTKAAEAEVDRFHKHWNAGEFQAIFDEAHLRFREAQPAGQLMAKFETVKKTYGGLKSSTKRSWGFNSDHGVTDVRLSYDSAFDHGAAVEEFVFRMTGEKPLLVSYDLASPEVAAQREAEKKAARDAKREAEEAERKASRDAREAERKARQAEKKKP